ncbi:MAG: hypothetical protein J6A97_05225 [Clostridia bacterium]|nr:hypothetical protein [Clostridia bacterium]
MDRTVKLDDKKYVINGSRFFGRKSSLPFESSSAFSIGRKFVCPKQVNDTVRVFFTGDFRIKEVRAGKKSLVPEKGEDGHIYYDVTEALKTGKTYITAEFSGGRAEGFFFDVKRTPANK